MKLDYQRPLEKSDPQIVESKAKTERIIEWTLSWGLALAVAVGMILWMLAWTG